MNKIIDPNNPRCLELYRIQETYRSQIASTRREGGRIIEAINDHFQKEANELNQQRQGVEREHQTLMMKLRARLQKVQDALERAKNQLSELQRQGNKDV